MSALFSELPKIAGHRPWPLPTSPYVMTMRWSDLLFAHWPVSAEALRAKLPAGLALDTFEGRAYLGVVPFRMEKVGPRGLPHVPGLSAFPELNVRTYVTAGGKPGVWFFSLDAANRLVVFGARAAFHLPYHFARMRVEAAGAGAGEDAEAATIDYRSKRAGRGAKAAFAGAYGPAGAAFEAAPGSLDRWLTERYCLYARSGDHLLRCEVHHLPWRLQPATLSLRESSMAEPLGLTLGGAPPFLHFSRRQDVVAWWPERVTRPINTVDLRRTWTSICAHPPGRIEPVLASVVEYVERLLDREAWPRARARAPLADRALESCSEVLDVATAGPGRRTRSRPWEQEKGSAGRPAPARGSPPRRVRRASRSGAGSRRSVVGRAAGRRQPPAPRRGTEGSPG